MAELHDIKGIGPATAARLAEHGLTSVKRVAKAAIGVLTAVPGFGPVRAEAVQAEARAALPAKGPKSTKGSKPSKAKVGGKKPSKAKAGKKKSSKPSTTKKKSSKNKKKAKKG